MKLRKHILLGNAEFLNFKLYKMLPMCFGRTERSFHFLTTNCWAWVQSV